jgi:hypothetical protein
MTDDHVSQTLRFLRTSQTVTAERNGRVVRYKLADPPIAELVATATSPRATAPKNPSGTQCKPAS